MFFDRNISVYNIKLLLNNLENCEIYFCLIKVVLS